MPEPKPQKPMIIRKTEPIIPSMNLTQVYGEEKAPVSSIPQKAESSQKLNFENQPPTSFPWLKNSVKIQPETKP